MWKILALLVATSSVAGAMDVVTPPSRALVRKKLAEHRKHNLASFHTYVTRGIYPHNTKRPGPLNVWLDDSGSYCAAATMILNDGHQDLVEQTAKTNNHVRLIDVDDGPLMDWMLTSGLTLEDVDRIQEVAVGLDGQIEQDNYVIEPRVWTAEELRLKKKYVATEAALAKQTDADLDLAADRLMAYPQLAWKLVKG
ncbi:MAG: hypothetical protein QM831_10675 [Kofleriaceae bacterium]